MAEPEKDQPSLELPKLSLRRRRRAAPSREPAPISEPLPDRVCDPVVPEPVADREPAATVVPVPEPEGDAEPARTILLEDPRPEPSAAPQPQRARPSAPRIPRIRADLGPGGMLAAVLTGAVVGLGIVGLTWASLRSCEGIQGTSSCGDAGYPLLGLILAAMVVVGGLLLRLLRVPEPGTTSFLAVGLAMALALLILVDHLMDRSMAVVLPLLCAATYAAAHWLTRTFAD